MIEPVHLMGRVAALRLIGGGGFPEGMPPEPPPEPPDPPPPPAPGEIVGPGASVTGGGATVTHVVNSATSDAWPKYKQYVLESGSAQRNIEIIGHRWIDQLREKITCSRSHLTVQGPTWTGGFKRGHQLFKGSDLRLEHLAFRPGDDVVNPDDADGLTCNPGSGSGDFMTGVLLYHVTALGGPDIGGIALLNGIREVTVQECMWGLGLYLSRHFEATPALNGHSKGFNITQIGQAVEHPVNILLYRNFGTTSTDRNPQAYNVDHLDEVNDAIYNWGRFCPRMNLIGGNFEGNMAKPGPQTTAHEAVIMSGTNGRVPSPIPNSIYLGGPTGIGNNLAIDMAAAQELASGVRRSSRYGTIYVEPDTASEALFEEVVQAAGRAQTDAFEQALKDHAIAGTSGGFVNGIDGPDPRLSWAN